jgi:hypothetical protein
VAIYICDYCNEMKDDDYHPMVESKDRQYVWLCEDCSLEVDEEAEEIPSLGGTMYTVTLWSIKGCKEVNFEAEGDMAAVKEGQEIIEKFEEDNACHVYREYLFRKDDDGTETELCI